MQNMQAGSSIPSLPSSLSIFETLLHSELARFIVMQALEFWRSNRFRGLYKVQNHHSTLELKDGRGLTAIFSKRQTVEFLQDAVVAIEDQAWGDGDLFAKYHCTPGVVVDRYKEGYRWKILISLRETKYKGDIEHIAIDRIVKNGFTNNPGNFQTQIDHPTKSLSISVIFPRTGLPRKVTLIEQDARRSKVLDGTYAIALSGGRVEYRYHEKHPRMYEGYIMKWEW